MTHICPEKADTTSSQWASLGAQTVKTPPELWETWAGPLCWEDPLGGGHGNPLSKCSWDHWLCIGQHQRIPKTRVFFSMLGTRLCPSAIQTGQKEEQGPGHLPPPRPERVVPLPGRGSQVGSKALPESPLNSLDDDISNKGGAAAEGKTWQELPSSQKMFSQKCLISLLEVRKCFLAIILHIPVFPSVFIPDPISPHLLHPLLAVSKRCQ